MWCGSAACGTNSTNRRCRGKIFKTDDFWEFSINFTAFPSEWRYGICKGRPASLNSTNLRAKIQLIFAHSNLCATSAPLLSVMKCLIHHFTVPKSQINFNVKIFSHLSLPRLYHGSHRCRINGRNRRRMLLLLRQRKSTNVGEKRGCLLLLLTVAKRLSMLFEQRRGELPLIALIPARVFGG